MKRQENQHQQLTSEGQFHQHEQLLKSFSNFSKLHQSTKRRNEREGTHSTAHNASQADLKEQEKLSDGRQADGDDSRDQSIIV